jgi:hypothetical protein
LQSPDKGPGLTDLKNSGLMTLSNSSQRNQRFQPKRRSPLEHH